MYRQFFTLLLISIYSLSSGQNWFIKTTEAARVNHAIHKNWRIAFGDYDQDGDEDMYAFTRLGENTLFLNQGDGRFEDISKSSGTADLGVGWSYVLADIDNDGWVDFM